MVPSPNPLLVEQSKPFRRADAPARGVSEGRLRRQDMHSVAFGVYVRRSPTSAEQFTLLERCRAAQLASGGDAVVSGPTAAALHGIPLPFEWEADQRIHLLALQGENQPRGRGIAGRRSSAPLKTVTREGVTMLAPVDAWMSLAGLLPQDPLVVAGERLWDPFAPLASEADVDAGLDRMRGYRGRRLLVQARRLMRPGSHSPQETRLRLLLERAGLPAGEPNGRIVASSGAVYFSDLVLRAFRVIFEYDGDGHRVDSAVWHRDVERLNDLAADGWLVVRFNRSQSDAAKVRMAIRALKSRGWVPVRPVPRFPTVS